MRWSSSRWCRTVPSYCTPAYRQLHAADEIGFNLDGQLHVLAGLGLEFLPELFLQLLAHRRGSTRARDGEDVVVRGCSAPRIGLQSCRAELRDWCRWRTAASRSSAYTDAAHAAPRLVDAASSRSAFRNRRLRQQPAIVRILPEHGRLNAPKLARGFARSGSSDSSRARSYSAPP